MLQNFYSVAETESLVVTKQKNDMRFFQTLDTQFMKLSLAINSITPATPYAN